MPVSHPPVRAHPGKPFRTYSPRTNKPDAQPYNVAAAPSPPVSTHFQLSRQKRLASAPTDRI